MYVLKRQPNPDKNKLLVITYYSFEVFLKSINENNPKKDIFTVCYTKLAQETHFLLKI
jgi:hypothetical protein